MKSYAVLCCNIKEVVKTNTTTQKFIYTNSIYFGLVRLLVWFKTVKLNSLEREKESEREREREREREILVFIFRVKKLQLGCLLFIVAIT